MTTWTDVTSALARADWPEGFDRVNQAPTRHTFNLKRSPHQQELFESSLEVSMKPPRAVEWSRIALLGLQTHDDAVKVVFRCHCELSLEQPPKVHTRRGTKHEREDAHEERERADHRISFHFQQLPDAEHQVIRGEEHEHDAIDLNEFRVAYVEPTAANERHDRGDKVKIEHDRFDSRHLARLAVLKVRTLQHEHADDDAVDREQQVEHHEPTAQERQIGHERHRAEQPSPESPCVVFINGPPGVGKTTLCKLLCAELGLAPVSTGDLLKENISQRTEVGCIAKQYIASKALVPDHVVVDMVAERVLECSLRDQGWVLDGFPRTVDQCSALRRKMISPTVVIILELPERECTKRITGRRFDGVTGSIYHLPNVTPRDPAVLARLTKRGDDTSEKLPPRFEAYRTYGEKTNALFSGVSHRIDASASPEELLEDVLALLHSIRPGGNSTSSISSNNLSDAMAGMTIQGNQPSQQQSFGILNPLPTPRSTIAQYQQQQQPKKQIVPQKIEEEEEDEDNSGDALDDMQEYNYDCDDDNGSAAKKQPQEPHRVSLHVSQKRAVSESSASSSSATSNASNNSNNNEELPSSSVPVVVAAANTLTSSPSAAALLPSNGVDMVKFKDMLLDGFEVLKHGRRGSPHARLIFTDMDFKRIFWQKMTKETSGGGRTKKAKLDQSLVLADVVQVVRGMKTEVLKRTGDVSKYERYLSLVADDRTLDMELPSDAACDFLLRGFDMLLHGGGR